MINYTEKGIRLHEAILAAGYRLWQENGIWKSTNDVAVQAIIDAYDPLPDIKADAIAAIKADGLARINAIYPAIDSFDWISFFADFWQSIASAAHAPVANLTTVINIYTAGKTAVGQVNAATDAAGVAAVIPQWP